MNDTLDEQQALFHAKYIPLPPFPPPVFQTLERDRLFKQSVSN